MRVPAAARPSWLLMIGAPPGGVDARMGLREALRMGAAARWAADDEDGTDTGYDGRGTALEER